MTEADGAASAREPEAPLEVVDSSAPHIARIYDYLLGGTDNFEVDRRAARQFAKAFPGIIPGVRAGRAFLARAVRYLAAEVGIRQYLDIGTGLPTADNTHEVAQRVAPECRVVYVDNDPLVLTHARALLNSSRAGKTDFIHADLRDTSQILTEAHATLDFRAPLAVMLVGVLHCIPDSDDPAEIVRTLVDAMPSGSYLVIGHPASDVEAQASAKATSTLNGRLADPVTWRTRTEIAQFFAGVQMVEPGLVQYPQWRPDPGTHLAGPIAAWCAIAQKP